MSNSVYVLAPLPKLCGISHTALFVPRARGTLARASNWPYGPQLRRDCVCNLPVV